MNYIQELIKDLENRDTDYCKSLSGWFYNILVATCGFLGALIALSDNTGASLHIRLVYVVSIVLGILGVLLLVVALLYETVRAKRIRLESRKRVNDGRNILTPYLSIKPPTFLLIFGIIASSLLILFLISITYYVIAKNFPELFS
jgi:MFS family permease